MAEVFLLYLLMFSENVISSVTDTLNDVLGEVAQVEFFPTAKLIVLLIAVVLGLGLLFRLILGPGSNLNRAISCSLGILCIYALTVVVYTVNPWDLSRFLSPLPMVSFRQTILLITSFQYSPFPALCTEILKLLILCFLVNILDSIIPKGSSVFGWIVLRLILVIVSILANLSASWAINQYLPGFLVEYAPSVLLLLLAAFFLLGITKALLGLVLTVVNPILGAAYAFFFSSLIGKQLSKAFLTSILMCLLFFLLEKTGYGVISITTASLLSYIPLAGSLLVLWYLLGHEL